MQVRAAQTRRALMLAAARLIDDRGMNGTGLLDISRAAGVSKGALYFHFASKDDLVTALRAEARDAVVALAEEYLGGSVSTLAGAARFTEAMSARMREDPVLRAGLRLEWEVNASGRACSGDGSPAAGDPACGDPDSAAPGRTAAPQSLRAGWLSVLRPRLEKDAACGRLRPGAGARDTANLVAAVTVGLEALGREDQSWWDPDVTDGIWRLLLMLAGPRDERGTTAIPDAPPVAGVAAVAASPLDAEVTPERALHEDAVFEGALRAGALREGAVRRG